MCVTRCSREHAAVHPTHPPHPSPALSPPHPHTYTLSTAWSDAEKVAIIRGICELGWGKWSQIAPLFPNQNLKTIKEYANYIGRDKLEVGEQAW